MGIAVRDVSKRFGKFTALEAVSVDVPSGSLTALLGPSGSGKSTLLRVIAGLERPDTGEVILDGENVTGRPPRMGLARALAVDPSVLLLDEPFGALDARVRKELRRWLRRLHDETHTTTLIVTHDQEEAMEVADRVVVMNHGRVEQIGGPQEL